MSNDLQTIDFNYFDKHRKELFGIYGHKFLVIKNKRVIGAYQDFDEAVQTTLEKEKLGTFIVQECVLEGEVGYVHTFQANVAPVERSN